MRAHLNRIVATALGVAIGALALRGGVGLLSPTANADIAGGDKPIIAVCAVPTLINELMQSDRFRPAREEVEPEARAELEAAGKELQEIREGLKGADPNAEEAQQRIQRFRELNSRATQLQMQIQVALDRKTAEQLGECFDLVRASADAVAEDLGFDYVIATGGVDEKFSTEQSEVTLRQITARPVIRFPKGADITDDVRDDLKLD